MRLFDLGRTQKEETSSLFLSSSPCQIEILPKPPPGANPKAARNASAASIPIRKSPRKIAAETAKRIHGKLDTSDGGPQHPTQKKQKTVDQSIETESGNQSEQQMDQFVQSQPDGHRQVTMPKPQGVSKHSDPIDISGGGAGHSVGKGQTQPTNDIAFTNVFQRFVKGYLHKIVSGYDIKRYVLYGVVIV